MSITVKGHEAMDRIGICDWLCRLWSTSSGFNEPQRRAIYGAIALVSQPKRFSGRHYVNLVFVDSEDNGDACGRQYREYRCEMRFSANAVSVCWAHDASDEMSEGSVHAKGRIDYDVAQDKSFAVFIERVENAVTIGSLAECAYSLGGAVVRN